MSTGIGYYFCAVYLVKYRQVSRKPFPFDVLLDLVFRRPRHLEESVEISSTVINHFDPVIIIRHEVHRSQLYLTHCGCHQE
jgi:hypothetical protein